MTSFRISSLILEITDGNIATQATHAIVNAANNELWMGAGVAGAIKSLGGARIEADAMSQGPIEPGECVVTTAGRLPAQWVIHAAVMGQDLRTSRDLIGQATRNALAIAERLGIASVAFPALGTGVGGFAIDECAGVMIAAVRAHAVAAASPGLVRLVLFGLPTYRAFVEVAGELLGTPLDGPPDCPLSS